MMKNILAIILLFFAGYAFGQVPDTVYLEGPTDGKYRVVYEITDDAGGQTIRKTEPLDSATTVLFLGNQIHDNELRHVAGARALFKKSELDAIYTDINASMTQVAGQGFLPIIWNRYRERYKGVYYMTNGQATVYAYVQPNRTITQIDTFAVTGCVDASPVAPEGTGWILAENGCGDEGGESLYVKPTQGGYSGTFNAITQNSFILSAFLPTNILPAQERLIRLTDDSNVFLGLNTALVVQKLR